MDDSSISLPCRMPRKRSSIFNPQLIENQQHSSISDYSGTYREDLETEMNKWRSTIEEFKQEFIQLKHESKEPKEVNINLDMLKKNFNLDIFDHTLYYDYLQSVQNLCIKFECLLDKKEQQEMIKYNNKYKIKL